MSIHLVCFLLLLGLRKQSESESTCDAMQLVLLLWNTLGQTTHRLESKQKSLGTTLSLAVGLEGDVELVGESQTREGELHSLGFFQSDAHILDKLGSEVETEARTWSTKKPGSKFLLTIRGPRLLMLQEPAAPAPREWRGRRGTYRRRQWSLRDRDRPGSRRWGPRRHRSRGEGGGGRRTMLVAMRIWLTILVCWPQPAGPM